MRKTLTLCSAAALLALGSSFALSSHDPQRPPPPDEHYMERIVEISLAEVRAGSLAARKAETRALREFSAMMVSEYAWTHLDLRALALHKGFVVPGQMNASARAELQALESLEGRAFDAAYAGTAARHYREALALSEIAARSARDPGIRELAEHSLPALRLQLRSAERLARALRA